MEWVVGVAVPILVAVGGVLGFLWRHRLEELRAAEERLSADRRKVYTDLLSPYTQLFTASSDKTKVEQVMMSAEYRATAFDFMLIASDDAAQAYNDLMQFSYKTELVGERSWGIMLLYGQLLLEIRRSLGNKDSMLTRIDMLRFLIKDIDKLEEYEASSGGQ